jgi:hypothetical protein
MFWFKSLTFLTEPSTDSVRLFFDTAPMTSIGTEKTQTNNKRNFFLTHIAVYMIQR